MTLPDRCTCGGRAALTTLRAQFARAAYDDEISPEARDRLLAVVRGSLASDESQRGSEGK